MKHGILSLVVCINLLSVSAQAQSPLPVSPGDQARVGTVSEPCPTFLWTAAETAMTVELVVYEFPTGSEPDELAPVLSVTLPGSAHGWTPSLEECLSRGRRYAWSVRSETASGLDEWSEASLFEIAGAPRIAEVEEALRVLRRYVGRTDRENALEEAAPAHQRARTGANTEGTQREDVERSPERSVALRRKALSAQTVEAGPSRQVTPPGSYALSIDSDFSLGGNIFKDGRPFLHNDGGSSRGNTALGVDALISTTIGSPTPLSGEDNTALGFFALRNNTSGRDNTAVGDSALVINRTGYSNTAVGANALFYNFDGTRNTAAGAYALFYNRDGNGNTAVGDRSLFDNDSGVLNTAIGSQALFNNYAGDRNTAVGARALFSNGFSYVDGMFNTALGDRALYSNTTGDRNLALGFTAGFYSETGSDNIWIGHYGVNGDNNTLRIGKGTGTGNGQQNRAFVSGIFGATVDGATDVPVLVDANDQLGTMTSSRRFKRDIQDIGAASGRLLDLRPISFRYKRDDDRAEGSLRFGLIAEEVAEVFPELVVLDEQGEPYTVRYHLLSALLLNELQRQHRRTTAQSWLMVAMLLGGLWVVTKMRRRAQPMESMS